MPDVFKILKENILLVLPSISEGDIIPENSLKELGANSIDRAEIIMLTLQTLRLQVPLITFSSAKNIADLITLFQESGLKPT